MDSYLKIKFKDKEYIVDDIIDFVSEHSVTNKKHNIFQIIANEIPNGLLTAISSTYPVKAEVLGHTIERPIVTLKTKMNLNTKKLQYTIIIGEKGE